MYHHSLRSIERFFPNNSAITFIYSDVGVIVENTACSNFGNCCDFPKPMNVTLCDNGGEQFYSYQLPPVESCSVAYCAGDKMPCDYNQAWDETKEECVGK